MENYSNPPRHACISRAIKEKLSIFHSVINYNWRLEEIKNILKGGKCKFDIFFYPRNSFNCICCVHCKHVLAAINFIILKVANTKLCSHEFPVNRRAKYIEASCNWTAAWVLYADWLKLVDYQDRSTRNWYCLFDFLKQFFISVFFFPFLFFFHSVCRLLEEFHEFRWNGSEEFVG